MRCEVAESRDDQEMGFRRGLIAETARHNRGAYKRDKRKAQQRQHGAPTSAKKDFRWWFKCL